MEKDIRHVIILMFENHSFDEMLGYMQKEGHDVDGIDDSKFRFNFGKGSGTSRPRVYPAPKTAYVTNPDPHHEHVNVMAQMEDNNGCFISEYLGSYPDATDEQTQLIMGYYEKGALPALHTLAENFCVCDGWFSSLPGPTWPNRLYMHSGTSNGYVTMPTCLGDIEVNFHQYDQPTIYQRLQEKGVPWKIYHHGLPQSLTLEKQHEYKDHYHSIDDFFADAASAEHNFPAYSFIEPSYMTKDQNDQHPPSDIRKGEELLAKVYNAIRANESLWNSTLFVVLYDEHGGFYDHVSPPKAVPPDKRCDEFSFDRAGFRVPAVLISPWVDAGASHIEFDHTSVLNYAIEKWGLGGLTDRVERANSIGALLNLRSTPRQETPESIEAPCISYDELLANEAIESHEGAWLAFALHWQGLMQGRTTTQAMGTVVSSIEASVVPKVQKLAEVKATVAAFLAFRG